MIDGTTIDDKIHGTKPLRFVNVCEYANAEPRGEFICFCSHSCEERSYKQCSSYKMFKVSEAMLKEYRMQLIKKI